jgi:hypothetical protein
MLVRAVFLWVGLNLGILALLAGVDLILFVRKSVTRGSGRRKAITAPDGEASPA